MRFRRCWTLCLLFACGGAPPPIVQEERVHPDSPEPYNLRSPRFDNDEAIADALVLTRFVEDEPTQERMLGALAVALRVISAPPCDAQCAMRTTIALQDHPSPVVQQILTNNTNGTVTDESTDHAARDRAAAMALYDGLVAAMVIPAFSGASRHRGLLTLRLCGGRVSTSTPPSALHSTTLECIGEQGGEQNWLEPFTTTKGRGEAANEVRAA